MKKHFIVFVILILLFGGLTSVNALAETPDVSAESAILMDAKTGTVLFKKNADNKMLVASTTKIMTALIVIENCSPEDVVEIKKEYTLVEGSSMYLREGEELTIRELLYGLMLSSGNDAATALAYHVSGSIEAFAELMNDKAAELGLQNSSFKNPHGLDTDGHYSSARDLAIITAAAMENKLFEEIASTKSIAIAGRSLSNHNKMLWNYEGCLGVKTGYTMAAGRSLVSCAERDGLRLICVTLNDPDDWDDHTALFDWGYENFEYVSLVTPQEEITKIPVISGYEESVAARAETGLALLIKKDDVLAKNVKLPKFLYATVTEGDIIGEIVYTLNGEEVSRIPLEAANTVRLDEAIRLTLWEKIKRAWYIANRYGLVDKYGYYGV